MKSFKNKKSGHVQNFEKKYKVSITDIPAVSKATGVPEEAIYRIISKGMGAFYSGGSRPNQNPVMGIRPCRQCLDWWSFPTRLISTFADDYGIKKKFTARGGARPKSLCATIKSSPMKL